MTDKELTPTSEQLKEINQWCGTEDINYYEGIEALGFLFKYAVPKLGDKEWYVELYYDKPIYVATIYKQDGEKATVKRDEDPALALFWAIYKIMEDEDGTE